MTIIMRIVVGRHRCLWFIPPERDENEAGKRDANDEKATDDAEDEIEHIHRKTSTLRAPFGCYPLDAISAIRVTKKLMISAKKRRGVTDLASYLLDKSTDDAIVARLTSRRTEIPIMATKTTWQPHAEQGELSTQERKSLPDSVYAFPQQRKEPLTDAAHVRNALARFDQVDGVSDAERDVAFANIKKAAAHYGVDITETNWRDLGKKPHTGNASH